MIPVAVKNVQSQVNISLITPSFHASIVLQDQNQLKTELHVVVSRPFLIYDIEFVLVLALLESSVVPVG